MTKPITEEQVVDFQSLWERHKSSAGQKQMEIDEQRFMNFIESLLSKQLEQHAMKMAGILAQADQKLTIYRADLLEKVEGLKKEDNLHPEMDEFGENCQCYECSSRDGFNQSLDQVLTLIKGDECKQ